MALLLPVAAAAQTPTPTTPARHYACPDRNGDGRCVVGIAGSEMTRRLAWPGLTWLLPDAAGICDLTADGQTTAELRARLVPAAAPDTCTQRGGSMLRGADGFVDVLVVDVSDYYALAWTSDAPVDGLCWGTGAPCRVDGEFVGSHATDVHAKCVSGPSYRTPCVPARFGTPTPCADDPGDYCQPWVFADGEAGVTVSNCPAGMCQQRAAIQTVYASVDAIVRAQDERGGVVALLINQQPYSATTDIRLALGTLRGWAHDYVRLPGRERVWLMDAEAWAQHETGYLPDTWNGAERGALVFDACIENRAVDADPSLEQGLQPRQRCARSPRPFEMVAWVATPDTPTATATRTPSPRATATQSFTAGPDTPTFTSTRTATPTDTSTPLGGVPTATETATRTVTPTGGTTTPTFAPLDGGCAPLVKNKVGASMGRPGREVMLKAKTAGFAPTSTAYPISGPYWLYNQIRCNDGTTYPAPGGSCTAEVDREFDHCDYKFGYQNECGLRDFELTWTQWLGNPTLLYGHCSLIGNLPSATEGACLSDADCVTAGAGSSCIFKSDTRRYNWNDDVLYPPAGTVVKAGRNGPGTFYEMCNAFHQAYTIPILQHQFADAWAYQQAHPSASNVCLGELLYWLDNNVGEFFISNTNCDLATPDSPTCRRRVNSLYNSWNQARSLCGAGGSGCALEGSMVDGFNCPASCPGAQIDCPTFFGWADYAFDWWNPVRWASQQMFPPE